VRERVVRILQAPSRVKKDRFAKLYFKIQKAMKMPYIVMHLGGSVVVPHISDEGGMDITFLKKFRKFLRSELKAGKRFVIVVGGGKTARAYQKTASRLVDIREEDLDWLGIHAIRINAHLLRTIFYKEAHPVIIDHDPTGEDMEVFRSSQRNLFFASGWRPGWSTDYIAIRLAEKFGTKEVIIAKDIPFVYDSDPRKNAKAKPIRVITWKEYKKLIPSKWSPGLSSPVDPVATNLAEKLGFKAKILKGVDLKNLKKAVEGKPFRGTHIS
jgi:uridylate kinase